MKVHSFDIEGPLLIEPTRFRDQRGFFCETYNALELAQHGIDDRFLQDNQSLSTACGTVRGLHFQSPPFAQAKLIRVVRGAILDVAVDIRVGSPTFGQHVRVELSAENAMQLYIPVGFAHGFATLRPLTDVAYKVSEPYSPEHEFGVLWNDPDLGIPWRLPNDEAVLSNKDVELPRLCDIVSPFSRYAAQSEVAA